MQLRSIRVTEKGVNLYVQGSLEQWLALARLTKEDFIAKYDADIFQLIKFINSLLNENAPVEWTNEQE
jgi:hypothetical protein